MSEPQAPLALRPQSAAMQAARNDFHEAARVLDTLAQHIGDPRTMLGLLAVVRAQLDTAERAVEAALTKEGPDGDAGD
jgi:hypothetical protein